MRKIKTCDITLSALAKQQGAALSFKESLEAAKLIEKAGADVVQLNAIGAGQKDAVTARSIASTLQNAVLCVECGVDKEAAKRTLAVLKTAKRPRINFIIPVSAVQMEYLCKMKPDKLMQRAEELIAMGVASGVAVELTLDDITRGEKSFYAELIGKAVAAGVKNITVSDNAGILLPDEAESFLRGICGIINDESVCCGFAAKNSLGVASANAAFAVKGGAGELKLAFNGVGTENLSLEQWAQLVRIKGDALGFATDINIAELQRLSKRLESIIGMNRNHPSPFNRVMDSARSAEIIENSDLGEDADIKSVGHRVEALGFDLTQDELQKVYVEFQALAAKKKVFNKDIEALVADMARQIPPTYKLVNYVINSGNAMPATAYIKLEKNGEPMQAVSMGDGPVDASFMAIEQIVGQHFELEEFSIQAVTEGREAIGDALIKLRYNGKLYAGRGIDTDIIGSSVRAYINAVNKILYEEKQ